MRRASAKPNQENSTEDEDDTASTETAETVPGGGAGVPPKANAPAAPARLQDEDPGPPVKRWRVTNIDGRRVLLGGGVVMLARGKVVDESNYDIELLRAAGVELEAVT